MYSTTDQLRANVAAIEPAYRGDADIESFCVERINLADKILTVDISPVVTMTTVDSSCSVVNLLSQYKAAELAHVRLGSVKRNDGPATDVEYWRALYDSLVKGIKYGTVQVFDVNGTLISKSTTRFTACPRADVTPAFGYGQYGAHTTEEELAEAREDIDADTDD